MVTYAFEVTLVMFMWILGLISSSASS